MAEIAGTSGHKIGIQAWAGLWALVLSMVVLTPAEQAWAGQTEQTKLTASDGAIGDKFGVSVSISGDYAIVGADGVMGDYNPSGAAYIFHHDASGWTQQVKLLAPVRESFDYYGVSVSIFGDRAIVGAMCANEAGPFSSSGAAYVYERGASGWMLMTKLVASDAAAGDWFGQSVSIRGDYAIVGASRNSDAGPYTGSAYVFHCGASGWTQQAKLNASDMAQYDRLGCSVSISDNYALVGAYGDDVGADASGSVYVFHRNASVWTQQAKLTASDAAANDYFGTSLSLCGDTAIVGADHKDDAGEDSGAAYVFERGTAGWTQQAKLVASDTAAGDWFGFSVSISGNKVAVTSLNDDHAGPEAGSAYLFERGEDGWTELLKLTASDAAAHDQFGRSVSLSDQLLIVGAWKDDDAGSESGSAYLFIPEPATLGLLVVGAIALLKRERKSCGIRRRRK